MDFIPCVQPLAILSQLYNGMVTQGTIHGHLSPQSKTYAGQTVLQ